VLLGSRQGHALLHPFRASRQPAVATSRAEGERDEDEAFREASSVGAGELPAGAAGEAGAAAIVSA
ncbi:unnamed protein product, partial [Urochloa humidicola]